MKLRSLRFKLSWNHALIISLVFVVIGLVRYATVAYFSKESFDKDLLEDAQLFASHLKPASAGSAWISSEITERESLRLESLQTYFVLTDMTGMILKPEPLSEHMQEMVRRGALKQILSQHSGYGSAETGEGIPLRFVSLALPSPGNDASIVLHLGRSKEALSLVLHEYFVIYMSSVPLVLIASVVVGWFLAGRALKPFEEVTKIARQITTENLNMQISIGHKEAEIQNLVTAFNAMVSRLNQSFKRIHTFNANVAHELRTPLAILQGENEVALCSKGLPEETRAILASNLEELERLNRIVNDLLILAEADAGTQILVLKAIRLKPLVEDLVEQMRLLAQDRKVRLELQSFPEVLIEADELWLRRALLNLIDNAIKYYCRKIRLDLPYAAALATILISFAG